MAVLESDKIMYEIYQEEGFNQRFRVVYYTELNDHNKEWEINRAMAGRHVHDGFIQERDKDEAKRVIDVFLRRLNGGEEPGLDELERALGDYAA